MSREDSDDGATAEGEGEQRGSASESEMRSGGDGGEDAAGRRGEDGAKDSSGSGGSTTTKKASKAEAAAEAAKKLAVEDAVMEPRVFEDLKVCLLSGQEPSKLLELLSDNYHGYAQMVNLMCEWHQFLGDDPKDTQKEVRSHLKGLIMREFDPKKADSVFSAAGSPPKWLELMVQDPEWRDLIYELSEAHPGSNLMAYAMERISQVGLEAEKAGAETAASNLRIFDTVLRETLSDLVNLGREAMPEDLEGLKKLACHNEHAFAYVLGLVEALAQDMDNSRVRRISHEIHAEVVGFGKGRQAEMFYNAVTGAAAHVDVCRAITAMVTMKKTNPSDVTQLYNSYTANPAANRPPAWLLQRHDFLEILVQAAFDPKFKIQPAFEPKYHWLLAYAATAEGKKSRQEEEDAMDAEEGLVEETEAFRETLKHIDAVKKLSKDETQALTPNALLTIRDGIEQSRLVSMGALSWVGAMLTDSAFYEPGGGYERLSPNYVRIVQHCAISHEAQREPVLDLTNKVWEVSVKLGTEEKQLAANLAINMALLLFNLGQVLRVLSMLRRWAPAMVPEQQQKIMAGVLSCCSPPYSDQLAAAFLNLMKAMPSLDALVLAADCKLLTRDFVFHLNENKDDYSLDKDLMRVLDDALAMPWGSGGT